MAHDEQEITTNEIIENKSRRKAVKTIAGGVTALAAYNLLPVRWEKPIIEQVFLPAHAQTSGEVVEEVVEEVVDEPATDQPSQEPPPPQTTYPLSSSPATLEARNDVGGTGEDVIILFNGSDSLTLQIGINTVPADAMLVIDSDEDEDNWDPQFVGSNWTYISGNFTPASDNYPAGSYFGIFSGYGNTFRLDFTVAPITVDPGVGVDMTVSGVTVDLAP